jgi:hypothetical protein
MNHITNIGISTGTFLAMTFTMWMLGPKAKELLIMDRKFGLTMFIANIVVFSIIGLLWWNIGFLAMMAGSVLASLITLPFMPWAMRRQLEE